MPKQKDQIWQATKFEIVRIFHYLMLISDSLGNSSDWYEREEAMLECREHWKKKVYETFWPPEAHVP